jgi:hypothetical protein
MNAATDAWCDQMDAHVAVTIAACYRFLDAWEDEFQDEEEDEYEADLEAARAALALFEAMTLFDSLMKQQPA